MTQVKIDANKLLELRARHGQQMADRMLAYREALLSGPQATARFLANNKVSTVSITLIEAKLKSECLWPL